MAKGKALMGSRIKNHPILGIESTGDLVQIEVDGKKLKAKKGEMIIAALTANNIYINRYTIKRNAPRGIFCGIGQCTDCVMVVNGKPNIRTCITPVKEGMIIKTQHGIKKEETKN